MTRAKKNLSKRQLNTISTVSGCVSLGLLFLLAILAPEEVNTASIIYIVSILSLAGIGCYISNKTYRK